MPFRGPNAIGIHLLFKHRRSVLEKIEGVVALAGVKDVTSPRRQVLQSHGAYPTPDHVNLGPDGEETHEYRNAIVRQLQIRLG